MSVLGVPGTMPKCETTRVYVWELPVRITHWAIAISIFFLAITGLYIAHPINFLPAITSGMFIMGYVRMLHLAFATVFGISVLARIAWMFMGNRFSHWDKFLPFTKRRMTGLIPTIRFYLFDLRKPPGFIGHNPLAGLAYTLVFLLYLAMMASGFAMYSQIAHIDSPFRMFDFLVPLLGGMQSVRWIHHLVMWLLLGFAGHHIYSAVLMSTLEANGTMESMFSGLKFVPPEDLVYSGYRFRERREIHELEVAARKERREAAKEARAAADDSRGG